MTLQAVSPTNLICRTVMKNAKSRHTCAGKIRYEVHLRIEMPIPIHG